jgi:hypothetical protein
MMRLAARVMASTSKVRLVVGLFGTAQGLAAALPALRAQGLLPVRINVIAKPDAFQGTLDGWWQRGELHANWMVCQPDGGAVPWTIAPAGGDGTAPGMAVNDARALLGVHHWALRRQAGRLHRCLEQGGALLLVEPDTEAEERAACTALLRYASEGVQTHEIARPQER